MLNFAFPCLLIFWNQLVMLLGKYPLDHFKDLYVFTYWFLQLISYTFPGKCLK